MSNLLDKLRGSQPVLLVSIPTNAVEPALAAQAGGADGIKVHANVTHHATGITFDSLENEAENIRKIVDAINIPVGLVPGENLELFDQHFLTRLTELGIDFMDSYSQFWPASLLKVKEISLWAAFDSSYSLDEMQVIASYPWVDAVEASIIPVQEYGKLLSWRDISNYVLLKNAIDKPLVIPSQRKLRPTDIPVLLDLGLKNFLLGAVSLGKKPEEIEKITRRFREAMGI